MEMDMMKIWIACAALMAAGAAAAQPCAGSAEKKLKFSNGAAPDTFVVEAFGATCADAKVLVYIKTAEQGWHAVHIGELANFASEEVSPRKLTAALKEIADRIEAPRQKRFETWDELQKAGTQPEGAPWRGTPLTKIEYERLRGAKPRAVIVPTDASRGAMYVWATDAMMGRPVPFVYYGD
jgi:hypothetical protein